MMLPITNSGSTLMGARFGTTEFSDNAAINDPDSTFDMIYHYDYRNLERDVDDVWIYT